MILRGEERDPMALLRMIRKVERENERREQHCRAGEENAIVYPDGTGEERAEPETETAIGAELAYLLVVLIDVAEQRRRVYPAGHPDKDPGHAHHERVMCEDLQEQGNGCDEQANLQYPPLPVDVCGPAEHPRR